MYIACYGNAGYEDVFAFPYTNEVEGPLTYNADGSPAWPDSISVHKTRVEALRVSLDYHNTQVLAYADGRLEPDPEVVALLPR